MYTKYPFKIENLRKFKIYKAEKLRLKVIIIGKDTNNLRKALENKKFKGTLIK